MSLFLLRCETEKRHRKQFVISLQVAEQRQPPSSRNDKAILGRQKQSFASLRGLMGLGLLFESFCLFVLPLKDKCVAACEVATVALKSRCARAPCMT